MVTTQPALKITSDLLNTPVFHKPLRSFPVSDFKIRRVNMKASRKIGRPDFSPTPGRFRKVVRPESKSGGRSHVAPPRVGCRTPRRRCAAGAFCAATAVWQRIEERCIAKRGRPRRTLRLSSPRLPRTIGRTVQCAQDYALTQLFEPSAAVKQTAACQIHAVSGYSTSYASVLRPPAGLSYCLILSIGSKPSACASL
jgi:hypothetical protein